MKPDRDPFQEWGAEAAVVILIAGLLAGAGILVYSLMQRGRMEGALLPAAGVAAAGCLVAAVIMRIRKQRERSSRPNWMGDTQQWQKELISRSESIRPPAKDKND